jgi:glucokinase
MPSAETIPAIELGGSHVSTARVDLEARRLLPGSRRRMPLDSAASAYEIIRQIVACARHSIGSASEPWGVALPGAFDFEAGIGYYSGAGKFESLDRVPLRPLLTRAIDPPPSDIAFVNDADAFVIGEWLGGAAAGERRAVGITLGTGVGSAFLEDGHIVTDDPRVPPEGRADLLTIDRRPLEETVSHRAIVDRHAALAMEGQRGLTSVLEIADAARGGDPAAVRTLDAAFRDLGTALAPWLDRFGTRVVVVGGGMLGAWDIIEPSLRTGIAASGFAVEELRIVPTAGTEEAALLGAAHQARERVRAGRA